MLLAVDIGNSFTKLGVFDGDRLLARYSVPTDPHIPLDQFDAQFPAIGDHSVTDAIVSSVVPRFAQMLNAFLRSRNIRTIEVAEIEVDLGIDYSPPTAIGSDRLVNAAAAVEKYGAPVLVCSFGTATTIDVIGADKRLIGGIIAPGIRTASEALTRNTAQLPEIDIKVPEMLIGNSTESAIRSGVVYGHVAMIEGLIDRVAEQLGSRPCVIGTGGYASLIASMSDRISTVDETLTLDGLRSLFYQNT